MSSNKIVKSKSNTSMSSSVSSDTAAIYQGEKDISEITKEILTSKVFGDDKETTIAKILLQSLKKSEDVYSFIQERLDKIDITTIDGQLIAGKLFTDLLDKQIKTNEQSIKAAETVSKFLPKQQSTQIAVGQSVKNEDITFSQNSITTDQFSEILKKLDNYNIDPIKQNRSIDQQLADSFVVDEEDQKAFSLDDESDDVIKVGEFDTKKDDDSDIDIEIIYAPKTPKESI
jgi:hypothetical protein